MYRWPFRWMLTSWARTSRGIALEGGLYLRDSSTTKIQLLLLEQLEALAGAVTHFQSRMTSPPYAKTI
jgi:hypothetical protein